MVLTVQVPLVNTNLATVSLEAFCYGIFFILSALSIYLIISHHNDGPAGGRQTMWTLFKKPMFVVSILLSITCTAHWTMTVFRSFQGFIYFEGGTNPFLFYATLNEVSEVVKTGFLMASLWIGDAAIIYRLWIIYGRSRWVIVFPIGTLIGLGICGVGITYQFTQFITGENVFASAAGRWITSDCVFTLCTNVYSTVAIAIRVWKSHRSTNSYGGVSLMPVLATLVESAALYTTWTIFFFAAYQTGSNLQFTAVDLWPQMSGIAFMLINVRVGLGWASNGRTGSGGGLSSNGHAWSRTDTRPTTGVPSVLPGPRGGLSVPQWDKYGQGDLFKEDRSTDSVELGSVDVSARGSGHPLEVNITRVINTEADYHGKTAPLANY